MFLFHLIAHRAYTDVVISSILYSLDSSLPNRTILFNVFLTYHFSDPFKEGDLSSYKSTEWHVVQERVIIHCSGNGSTISTYSWLGDLDATRDTQGNPFLLFPAVPFSYHSISDLTPADKQPDVFTELASVISPSVYGVVIGYLEFIVTSNYFSQVQHIYQYRFLLFKCSPMKSCFHSSQPHCFYYPAERYNTIKHSLLH